MTPALLIALLQNIALPELMLWLKARHASSEPIDDAAILAKLQMDVAQGNAVGQAWLDAHPAIDPPGGG